MAASGAFAEGCQTRGRVRRTRPRVRYPASYSRGGSLNPGKSLPCIVPGPAGGLRVAGTEARRDSPFSTDSQVMADSMSAAAEAAPIPDQAAIERAEAFTRERFVHDGEDAAVALAPGSARRRALEDALREIDAGAMVPSTKWRRRYALLLGLERVLSEDEPRLADGALLNPHQVDALSGTLTALLAAVQNGHGLAPPPAEPVLAVDDEPEPEPEPPAAAAPDEEPESEPELDEEEDDEDDDEQEIAAAAEEDDDEDDEDDEPESDDDEDEDEDEEPEDVWED